MGESTAFNWILVFIEEAEDPVDSFVRITVTRLTVEPQANMTQSVVPLCRDQSWTKTCQTIHIVCVCSHKSMFEFLHVFESVIIVNQLT